MLKQYNDMDSVGVQFSHNTTVFASKEKAIRVLKGKNLLPGEPAQVFYKDEDNVTCSILGVGDFHNSNNPLIIDDYRVFEKELAQLKALIEENAADPRNNVVTQKEFADVVLAIKKKMSIIVNEGIKNLHKADIEQTKEMRELKKNVDKHERYVNDVLHHAHEDHKKIAHKVKELNDRAYNVDGGRVILDPYVDISMFDENGMPIVEQPTPAQMPPHMHHGHHHPGMPPMNVPVYPGMIPPMPTHMHPGHHPMMPTPPVDNNYPEFIEPSDEDFGGVEDNCDEDYTYTGDEYFDEPGCDCPGCNDVEENPEMPENPDIQEPEIPENPEEGNEGGEESVEEGDYEYTEEFPDNNEEFTSDEWFGNLEGGDDNSVEDGSEDESTDEFGDDWFNTNNNK